MVQELRELMRECTAEAPHDDGDLGAVLRGGRRRVRVRRAGVVAGGALTTAAVVGVASLVLPLGGSGEPHSAGVPRPDGPVVRLSDAVTGVEGRDFDTLFTHTNENLDRANGQYFGGVTDDGLLLWSDGPRGIHNEVRYALVDPATGEKDWLPTPPGDAPQAWSVELTEDRLVLVTPVPVGNGMRTRPGLAIFDRGTRTWRTVTWPDLPATQQQRVEIGPDGRAYVATFGRSGGVPEGGWPTGADGEADDADAKGDTYRLWSASLTDPNDVRDEGLMLGDFAFTDDGHLVYTDRTNGDPGDVHVRDLASGEETAFDPRTGDRCNLLGFGVSGEDVVMSQYCGTYGDVRDDRVQVLTTDGDLVTTLQGSGIEGGEAGVDASGDPLVAVTSYAKGEEGTYVYEVGSGRLVRVSETMSRFASGDGPTPDGELIWSVGVNRHKGQTQVLARWLR